ncbi:MAG: hypothetical protein R8L58_01895 [Mariprofundaceae bacterium]
MQQLQLLLVQAASLAALPQKQAQEKATMFARRAMSGPEMNAMHHGDASTPAMQRTHALGDAVFALLEARAGGADDGLWRSRVLFASQAAWLRLTGSMQGDALGRFSYSQGRQLAATQFMRKPDQSKVNAAAKSPYAKAAAQMVEKLNALAVRF